MQIIIRTINDKLYTYDTVAQTAPTIRTELESAASFIVRSLDTRLISLIPRHAVAEFIQQSAADYLRSFDEK